MAKYTIADITAQCNQDKTLTKLLTEWVTGSTIEWFTKDIDTQGNILVLVSEIVDNGTSDVTEYTLYRIFPISVRWHISSDIRSVNLIDIIPVIVKNRSGVQ